jgi:diaminopimelate epimerase (EC 5.1.1.7)
MMKKKEARLQWWILCWKNIMDWEMITLYLIRIKMS